MNGTTELFEKNDVEFQVQIKGWDIRVIPSDLPPSCWDNVPSLTDLATFPQHI